MFTGSPVSIMQEYTIERISIANINHLQTLCRSTYSKKVTLEYLTGKYDTKFLEAKWLGYLAFTPSRKPAAFYGVIPCRFKIREEIFLAAQSADTMTHPDHQKKGLFIQLAKKTYELARQEGVQFIFGFPNQNSYTGFIKLNWRFAPDPMQLFVLKGSKVPWAALLLRIPVLKNLYEYMVEKYFTFQNREGDFSGEHGVIRDALFLKYKNQYTRTFIKKSKDIFAWMKNDGSLKIGLLTFGDTTRPESVENFLRHTAKTLGCHSIILMTTRNTPLYKTLVKITAPRDGLPIGFYNLTNRHLNFDEVRFEYCDIDIF